MLLPFVSAKVLEVKTPTRIQSHRDLGLREESHACDVKGQVLKGFLCRSFTVGGLGRSSRFNVDLV